MATQNFNVGELVFAKLKGYPPWPAVITNCVEKLKSSRKKCILVYCVYFFGSRNYGFIKSDKIFLYEKHKKAHQIKTASFRAALYEIEDYKKGRIEVYFPKIDSKSSQWEEQHRFVNDCFAALKKKDDRTGSSNFFNLNHINLSDSNTSKLDNLLPCLRKLETDKGDENNCFTNHDELHKKHNDYRERKLFSSFLDVVNKFEDYVYTENEETFDDPHDLECKNKIRDLGRYSAIIKNIEDYMYRQTHVFNPDNKDILNEPSSSNNFQNEISLEDMFLNALKEMGDYVKKDATILNAINNDRFKNPSVYHKYKVKFIQMRSFLNALNAFKDHENNLNPNNKEIFNKPSTKDENEKKGSDRNVSNGNNEELLNMPSCSKMFQNKKLDVDGKDKKLHSRKCFPRISSKENIVSKPYKRKVVNKLRNRLTSENNKELPEENICGNRKCLIVLEELNLSPIVLVKRLKL